MRDWLSLLPLVVLSQVPFFLFGEFAEGVDYLAAVVLAVAHVFHGAEDGEVDLAGTGANVIPVDEVNVGEFTQIQFAVLDGEGLASAEEDGTKVAVGIHRGEVTGFVHVAAVLRVHGAGVTVLMLLGEIGDHLSHDVQKVVLQELQVEGVEVVGALLDHDGAGGVVRYDGNSPVLDAGFFRDLMHVEGDVVEGGDPASGLKFDLFLNHFEFHCIFLLKIF